MKGPIALKERKRQNLPPYAIITYPSLNKNTVARSGIYQTSHFFPPLTYLAYPPTHSLTHSLTHSPTYSSKINIHMPPPRTLDTPKLSPQPRRRIPNLQSHRSHALLMLVLTFRTIPAQPVRVPLLVFFLELGAAEGVDAADHAGL